MRQKIPDELKKQKISITLDTNVIKLLKEHLKNTKQNRSKYIQQLINGDKNLIRINLNEPERS